MPDYWLDSDTLIRPYRELTFDWLPSLWTTLREKGVAGVIASSEYVYEEVKDGDDALAEWAAECQDFGLWVPADESVQRAYSAIADYVAQHQTYAPEHVATFLGKADAWIIARAQPPSFPLSHPSFPRKRESTPLYRSAMERGRGVRPTASHPEHPCILQILMQTKNLPL